jgi:hypothetical protein
VTATTTYSTCLPCCPCGRLEGTRRIHVRAHSGAVFRSAARQYGAAPLRGTARVGVVLACSQQLLVTHSALSTSAVGVRAAYLPGSAATTFPSTSAPMPT